MVNSKFILVLSLCFTALLSVAQEVKFSARVSDQTVAMNEQFKVVFEINASGTNFRPPVLTDNFRVLNGPMTSSQMRYVNGKISSSLSYTYVLKPIDKGDFIIEPATIEVEGEAYSSNPIKIQVTKGTNSSGTQSSKPNQSASTPKSSQESQHDIFISETVNKRTVYQGDQIVVTYKLYTRETADSYEFDQIPDFRGFYTKEIDINPPAESSRAEVNGKIYSVYPIKRTLLFPQVNGEGKIDPLKMSFRIRVKDGEPVQTFFGPRYRTVEKTVQLASNPITVDVKALPAGAPESFNGAVGNFQFSGNIDQTNTKVNEAINLNIKLSGRGNISLTDLNLPDFPIDFEVYDPDVKSNVSTAGNAMSGTKSWSILMIPRTNGSFEIPAIRFSYFDPSKKQYVEETVGPFQIEVTGEGGNGSISQSTSSAQREIQRLGNDIRYINTGDPELKEPKQYFFHTSWFYFMLVLPFILLAGALFAFRKLEERSKDVLGSKKRSANKMATKQLAQAKKAMAGNDRNQFFDAVYKALFGYLGDKLSFSVGELNKETINKELLAKNVDESTIQRLNETLEYCEMGRFAPVNIELNQVYKQSEEVILKLEDQIK